MLPFSVEAQKGQYFVRGIVRDSVTLEPLPYASVIVPQTKRSAITDEKGMFELPLNRETMTLEVSCLGYEKRSIPVKRTRLDLYDILLAPGVKTLKTVEVKKAKYRKKDNPAVRFAKMLRNTADINDPLKRDYYSYEKYEKMSYGWNNTDSAALHSGINKHFDFLEEHLDTSEVTGKPVIITNVTEKLMSVNHRRDPKATKEFVKGYRAVGSSYGDPESFQVFLEDAFREVNLYDNDINLFQYRFVSPLSPIATDFYKFYLTDTAEVDGERCIVLSCYPMNKATFGFIGHIYVAENDSSMFVKRVELKVPNEINLNFIHRMYLSQTYARAEDGSRLKTLDDLTVEVQFLQGLPEFYLRKVSKFSDHSFEAPPEEASVFSGEGKTVSLDSADVRDDVFWERARMVNLTNSEEKVPVLNDRMRKNTLYRVLDDFLRIMSVGYIGTSKKKSYFDIGPVNTLISFNDIEGVRLRFGGITTTNLSKQWFFSGMGAFGTKDHRWKYRATVDYSLTPKKIHPNEFPVKGFRLSQSYDLDYLGQHYNFSNPDNIFLSLKRMSNYKAIYCQETALQFKYETLDNFTANIEATFRRELPTPWIPFETLSGQHYNHLTRSTLKFQARYAPGEKFYQGRGTRMAVNFDAPTVLFTHTFTPKGFLGSKFGLNKTELAFAKRFWFSAFGYVDASVSGSYVWGKTDFMSLIAPNANLSYTLQPESYDMLNPMEFLLDKSVSWQLTYFANGTLLNYIPLVKKLKLREVVSWKGVYGRLSDRNRPSAENGLLAFPEGINTVGMHRGPYMELSAGLDNIIKCLRVEYVWRLSYLDVPYKIDRHGLRIALHFSF